MSSEPSLDFFPDSARVQLLDGAMHAALADSIAYLDETVGRDLGADAQRAALLVGALRAGRRFPSTVFSSYYGMVDALLDEDPGTAREFYDFLLGHAPHPAGFTQQLTSLDRAPGAAEYHRCMVPSLSEGLSFRSPTDEVMREFSETYRAALALLQSAVPELAAEVLALVREVVGVTGAPGDRGYFQGGSHFQLWGALFLNAERFRTRVEVAEVVAHESAHSLLFGFCTEEPLVLNEDSELYPSPLRRDPRPMDGIYHATFVSARMHWAMHRLLHSGLLDAREAEAARTAMQEDHENFRAGDTVVRAHGRLTRHGAALLGNARAYMDSVVQ